MKRDIRVDQYILNAEAFAQPVLMHLRELIHIASNQVEEKIKWGFPHFEYKGEDICSMASFKKHCSFIFWKAALMKDKHKVMQPIGKNNGMGNFGKITSLKDLPSDKILLAYLNEALVLNDKGIKVVKPKKEKIELVIPKDFSDFLSQNYEALETFNNFSYSCKKEYIFWINEAKTEATRNKRINTAVEWLTEGKRRDWKYTKK